MGIYLHNMTHDRTDWNVYALWLYAAPSKSSAFRTMAWFVVQCKLRPSIYCLFAHTFSIFLDVSASDNASVYIQSWLSAWFNCYAYSPLPFLVYELTIRTTTTTITESGVQILNHKFWWRWKDNSIFIIYRLTHTHKTAPMWKRNECICNTLFNCHCVNIDLNS